MCMCMSTSSVQSWWDIKSYKLILAACYKWIRWAPVIDWYCANNIIDQMLCSWLSECMMSIVGLNFTLFSILKHCKYSWACSSISIFSENKWRLQAYCMGGRCDLAHEHQLPYIPPESLNWVPALIGVKAWMSPLQVAGTTHMAREFP